MSEAFVAEFRAAWSDMDFNQHLRNAAYLEYGEQTRMLYLESRGFTMERFQALQLGPVVLEDRLVYKKELRLLEPFRVDLAVAGSTQDGRRMKVRNRIFRHADGALCATVDSLVLWFDLAARKPVAPPRDLKDAWMELARTEDFAWLDAPG